MQMRDKPNSCGEAPELNRAQKSFCIDSEPFALMGDERSSTVGNEGMHTGAKRVLGKSASMVNKWVRRTCIKRLKSIRMS